MKCPRCQQENPPQAKFCLECGAPLGGAVATDRSYAELQAENEGLRRSLGEASEQQTATAEILRVISNSPTDLQPVLGAMAERAARLCAAYDAIILRLDGEVLRRVAHHGPIAPPPAPVFPATRDTVGGRTVLDRRPIHVADLQAETKEFPMGSAAARQLGSRTVLGVPLLREGAAIGVIYIRRTEVRPFTEAQIALLQTFADQAVIAIENVRLFTELRDKNRALTEAHTQVTEALEQQTATSEILRVISSSPTDLQPVLDAVVKSASRLCDSLDSVIFRLDGDRLRLAAHHGPMLAHGQVGAAEIPLNPGLVNARAVIERRPIHVADLQAEGAQFPEGSALARTLGMRTTLCVPLMREGVPVGVIALRRADVRPFANRQIELVTTFADQAVIAIENVRLFKELQEKNRALTQAHGQVTEALEQQTATSDILRVISSSPTDVQPVFDAIVRSASMLCDGEWAIAVRFDGEFLHLAAHHNPRPGVGEAVERLFPRRPDRGLSTARAVLEKAMVHIPDTDQDPDFDRDAASAQMARSMLAVPLVRHGNAIGAIGVSRGVPGPFSEKQMALLQTFADQAVIAIENVRLFNELQARTGDLTRSVEQLTALGEVGRAVSSTLDLETVLTTIVSRAVQLAGLDAGAIYEYDEAAEVFHLRATQNLPDEFLEIALPLALPKGEGATGRLAVTREPVQIPDVQEPGAYHGRMRDVLLRLGHRALLAVPLISEGHIVGGLVVNRREPGVFGPQVIDLLRTFATQSALAIQNARLFREIEEKSRQLERASQHKSEFLANMSHELRTPLNAVIGFSEVLGERLFGELNEKQAEYVQDINASGTHLLSLINDILDLSKIEAGRMELELADFHLPQAIENALVLVRERALRRGIMLEQSIDPRLGEIQGDERKVKQVLLNLLSNAIKFTPEGGKIEIRAVPGDRSVEVSVSDTGVGIAPEDQEAIFEEFRQVGTAAKKVEGTGLGLALSRKFIELHGGRIWVHSQVGVGSTFTFTIPARRDG